MLVCGLLRAAFSYVSPRSPRGQLQRNALPTGLQSPPFWQGFGMQGDSSTSQRPPVKPALQLHAKPVGNKYEVYVTTAAALVINNNLNIHFIASGAVCKEVSANKTLTNKTEWIFMCCIYSSNRVTVTHAHTHTPPEGRMEHMAPLRQGWPTQGSGYSTQPSLTSLSPAISA